MEIITNTFGIKNFNNVNFDDANVVVIMNANDPTIALLKVGGTGFFSYLCNIKIKQEV